MFLYLYWVRDYSQTLIFCLILTGSLWPHTLARDYTAATCYDDNMDCTDGYGDGHDGVGWGKIHRDSVEVRKVHGDGVRMRTIYFTSMHAVVRTGRAQWQRRR